MKYTHDGIEILLDNKGTFTATKDGAVVSSTSLAGIKKKLDSKSSFQRFAVIYEKWGVFETAEVVGVKRPRSNASWRSKEWLLSNGETTFSVIDDTADNRALIEEIKKLRAEKAATDKKYQQALAVLNERIVTRKPE